MDQTELVVLSNSHLQGAFYLWLIGVVAAVAALLLEVRRRPQTGVSTTYLE
jgi:hypothetical protein